MNNKTFINLFPFSIESREYITQTYIYSPNELYTKYPKELEYAYDNIIYLISRKILRISDKYDNSLIYVIMQILINAAQNNLLYEYFSEAYRKNVIKTFMSIRNRDEKNREIEKLSINTFKINIQFGNYLSVAKEYEFKDINNKSHSKLEWRVIWNDYLRALSEIRGVSEGQHFIQWKLAEQQFKNGWIYLSSNRMIKYLGYITKKFIKSKYIPYLERGLFDEREIARIKKVEVLKLRKIPFIMEYVKNIQNEIQEISPYFEPTKETGIIMPYYPPCMKYLITIALKGEINLDHYSRLVLVYYLLYIGVDKKNVISVFQKQPDYNETKTSYFVNDIEKKITQLGQKSYGCNKLKTMQLCRSNEDPLNWCQSGKIHSPAQYYFKRKYLEEYYK